MSRTEHGPGEGHPGRVLDISRLLYRLQRNAPTGIDRVELAYAKHYVEQVSGDRTRFILTTPVSSGLLTPTLARHLVRTAIDRWTEPVAHPEAEKAFEQLVAVLRAPVQPGETQHLIKVVEPLAGILEWAASAMIATVYIQAFFRSLGDPGVSVLRGTPSWYLNVSHINVHEPARFKWITSSGTRAMFMVHDLIPISHPEYFNPNESALHRRRIETMARLGDLLIFNSAATKAAWDDYVKDAGLPNPPGAVVPLGVDEVFLNACKPETHRGGTPYFVVIGTIEGRKNLSFLLQVWREWVQKYEVPPARLVIIGRRGRQAENIFDLLDRSAPVAVSVVEVAELADSRVAALVHGARALLAPSLIEGFGLPIAEALAMGVPVIASDGAAHREAGGSGAEYLDPTDGRGWMAALDAYLDASSRRRSAAVSRMAALKPTRWSDHIRAVEDLLGREP